MTCQFNYTDYGTAHCAVHCIVHDCPAIRHDADTHWVCQSDEAAMRHLGELVGSGAKLMQDPVGNERAPVNAWTPSTMTRYLHADGYRSHVVEWNDADPSRPRLVRREAEPPLTWAEVLAAGSKDAAADVLLEYSDQPQRSSELEVQEQGTALDLTCHRALNRSANVLHAELFKSLTTKQLDPLPPDWPTDLTDRVLRILDIAGSAGCLTWGQRKECRSVAAALREGMSDR